MFLENSVGAFLLFYEATSGGDEVTVTNDGGAAVYCLRVPRKFPSRRLKTTRGIAHFSIVEAYAKASTLIGVRICGVRHREFAFFFRWWRWNGDSRLVELKFEAFKFTVVYKSRVNCWRSRGRC